MNSSLFVPSPGTRPSDSLDGPIMFQQSLVGNGEGFDCDAKERECDGPSAQSGLDGGRGAQKVW